MNKSENVKSSSSVDGYAFDVSIGEPKPNKMFSAWQTAITKFLTYRRAVKCAHCGKMSKHHWTQLKFFRVMDEGAFVLKTSKALYPPLTPVCSKHILSPET